MKKNKNKRCVIRFEERFAGGYGYKYFLYECESARVASYGIPLYSIGVELTDAEGEVTRSETKDLFADLGKANSFFEKLVRGLATPIDLVYIVEDEINV